MATPAGTKAPFPKSGSPVLATLVDKPVDEPGWIYEMKWDGYRAMALNKGTVHLISRNKMKDFTRAKAMELIKAGEIFLNPYPVKESI